MTHACWLPAGNIQLQHDLALLLIRLQQWQQAQAVLSRCLDRCKEQPGGTESVTAQADTLALIAKSVAREAKRCDCAAGHCVAWLHLQRPWSSSRRCQLPGNF